MIEPHRQGRYEIGFDIRKDHEEVWHFRQILEIDRIVPAGVTRAHMEHVLQGMMAAALDKLFEAKK